MTENLARLPAQPESGLRHHLTILFTDLSDSTRLTASMEAETYAELQDDVRRLFRDVVQQHGGTINQFQGDGLQALFGDPQPSEHDGRRATEVALEVHDRVRALRAKYQAHGAPDLSVHSAVHAGLVLIRQGDDRSARLELFGPAPGIAKHLSDMAERDEILVSEETLGPGSHFFLTSERRLLSLKGRAEPLAVHRILARTSLRTRFEAHAKRGLVPFIGRSAELLRLEQALERVGRGGPPSLVAISAPAGVGKTRLAEELLRRAAGSNWAISRGYCESDLSAEPLQPFLQMLRSRLPTAPGAAQAAQSMTPLRELLPEDAPNTPEQTIAALCKLFADLARAEPQVVFIDDWQWADDATRQVVYSIRELTQAPILLLVATRPFEQGDAQLTAADVLELGPFSEAEAASTIDQLLPSADPFVADEIRRYSGGNPLFIEELCHSAAGVGPGAGLAPVRGGSAWLETLIESRVARLPREQGELLSAAAVIGNVVPIWLLHRLTGYDEQHSLVRALAAHDLMFPGGDSATLRFKHGITRDVIYGALGLRKRRTMHQAIARLIRGRTEPAAEVEACEALAYHHAGAAEFGEAAHYAAMAGDKAVAASSIDRAKTQYRAALEMLDRLPAAPERYQAWRTVVRRLGLATVYDPSRGELEVFARAVDRAREHQDAAGLAYAEYWLAYVNYALGESRAAVEHCEAALQAATELRDVRLVGQARATLGQALAAAGEYRGALDLLDQVVAARRDNGPGAGAAAGMAFSLASKASILGDMGRFGEAHDCFEEAQRTLPGHGHEVEGSVLCWRSGVNLWQGRWEAARQDALAAHRVAERVKSLYLFASSRGLSAYAEWKLDPGTASLRRMVDAAAWLESRDKNLFVSLHYGWLAEALANDGRPAEARGYAARALRRVRKRDWLGAAMASRAMAGLAADEGDWRTAERHLALADRAARVRGSAHELACNELCRARIAQAQGVHDTAAASLARATSAFERMQMHWHLAQAARLQQKF